MCKHVQASNVDKTWYHHITSDVVHSEFEGVKNWNRWRWSCNTAKRRPPGYGMWQIGRWVVVCFNPTSPCFQVEMLEQAAKHFAVQFSLWCMTRWYWRILEVSFIWENLSSCMWVLGWKGILRIVEISPKYSKHEPTWVYRFIEIAMYKRGDRMLGAQLSDVLVNSGKQLRSSCRWLTQTICADYVEYTLSNHPSRNSHEKITKGHLYRALLFLCYSQVFLVIPLESHTSPSFSVKLRNQQQIFQVQMDLMDQSRSQHQAGHDGSRWWGAW